ncbi:glutaminyl-peptide cyclotransferase [Mycolicibacterium cyprinidarum]|uniref:Glutaminyl-peptide cyclotransferase n=1 Tax=Mycolicibacterium cyprinidarum TaxID=2860311 RepID=A0ABQ4VB71_9MYCO|nr:glutaminyl-peptide cyclotransferase [Mycolicibacterium sp. NGTWS0302]GJF14903.1 glutaminyl-peptide cyclotransferase [Mycolicibacterium sp. NGTWSNA01]
MTKWQMWAAATLVVSAWAVPPAAHAQPVDAVPVIEPVVLEEIEHDPTAFTEGLELHIGGGALFEGTGLAGASQLRELDPATGRLRRESPVPNDYFGEGITVVGDRIWQLTYRDGVAVEWDAATLSAVREVPLVGEGWGLCYDGERLIRSDGTNRLRFHNPDDMTEIGGIDVTRDGRTLNGLNELECVDGQVWANLWPSDNIVRIDPGTGSVNLVVDAAGLRTRGIPASAQVLNGIAHVQGDEFLLTGKDWPKTFRVQLGP